jgi:hypothetical protein
MKAVWVAAPAGPHVRRFHDGSRMWSVWEVTPELLLDMGVAHDALADDLRDGWLCFKTGTERRRFSPLPAGWYHLSDAQLGALCQRAAVVPGDSPAARAARANEEAIRPEQPASAAPPES